MSIMAPLGFDPDALVRTGWTTYRINPLLVVQAHAEMQGLIQKYGHLPKEEREFSRPGETVPDLGVIRKDGTGGTDNKYFVHYATDFGNGREPLRQEPLLAVRQLYRENLNAALQMATALERYNPELFRGLRDRMWTCLPVPFGTTILRGLYYPAVAGEKQGAQKHVDRSLLTQHMGDKGGHLLGYTDEHDSIGTPLNLSVGEVLVFFGVKILYVTNGRVSPLWHGSETAPGEDRQAIVNFAHADVGVEVEHAKRAYDAFWEKRARCA